MTGANENRRVLVIDDNRAVHDDIRKVLRPEKSEFANRVSDFTTELFGRIPSML